MKEADGAAPRRFRSLVQMSDLFDSFISRITPTEHELEIARQHRDTVASRIRLEGVVELINSGSYIKGTSIRPFTDLDLFVGFDATEYEAEEERVITRLHYHLGQSFPASQVRLQTHSVGVIFSDGFRVDVVPGFALTTRIGYYRVRNRDDGRWVTTSISRHKEFFTKRQNLDARFRDMIRLAKHWKNQRRRKYSSFLFELLVAKAFKEGIPQGRDIALHAFFEWMATGGLRRPVVFNDYYSATGIELPRDALVVLDPSDSRNNVASAIDRPALDELVAAADWSRARSQTALSMTSRRESANCWRDMLPGFPFA